MRQLPASILMAAFVGGIASRATNARAQAPSLPGREASSEEPRSEPAARNASVAAEGDRVWVLEERISELEERLRRAEDDWRSRADPLTIGGYVDIGFFAPIGNDGVGWVRDAGNTQFPRYDGYGWTFVGDILGSPVNSRGEAADLGDAPGIDRFDSVNSQGAPGFIANEVNLRLDYSLAQRAILRTSVNFLPRSAERDFAVGDFVEVDLAELEYVLTEEGSTSLFVGKILPVFGIEYKNRKSDQRFGVTPSLIARYTTGPQLGVKLRSKLFDDWLILAASLTNNTSTVEQFDFYREVDANVGKVLGGRVALRAPLDAVPMLAGDRLEVGISGEWGAQDGDTRSDGEIWFVGADLEYRATNFSAKAEVIRGEAPGSTEERVWALDLKTSGYVELDWQALPELGFLLRAGLRDSVVSLATERAYITDQARFTGGARWVINPNMLVKAEYYHNLELGDVEPFDNDMFTSSLLLRY